MMKEYMMKEFHQLMEVVIQNLKEANKDGDRLYKLEIIPMGDEITYRIFEDSELLHENKDLKEFAIWFKGFMSF
jgi:hypothetical protein